MSAPVLRAACEQIRDGLRLIADGFHTLSLIEPAGATSRPTAARDPETLLTVQEAADLLRSSVSHIERLTRGKPCRRKAGRKVLIERAGLLALVRKG